MAMALAATNQNQSPPIDQGDASGSTVPMRSGRFIEKSPCGQPSRDCKERTFRSASGFAAKLRGNAEWLADVVSGRIASELLWR